MLRGMGALTMVSCYGIVQRQAEQSLGRCLTQSLILAGLKFPKNRDRLFLAQGDNLPRGESPLCRAIFSIL